MYIPEKLKLNRFKHVNIPRNKEYFSRLGLSTTPSGAYSGEEMSPMPSTKVEDIDDYARYARRMQDEADSKANQD